MSVITSPGDIPPTQPTRYGKYFLVRKLAEGGMAEIFLAKQVGEEGFERNVVIKRMLSNLSSSPDFVTMFLDEARLAARLAHPNIVQIHDLGTAEGCYYICMEYLAGEDFSAVLRAASKRREYVPMGIVLRILIEAAHGLQYAHEFADESGRALNLVHRDISPSNIFVTYVGQVKVLDFGIAKAESRTTHTTAGVVKGKYMYMAPEQARGQQVDRRADVFSLGVSLYEALTNVRPFARDVELAILNAVLTADFRPPRELRPEISPELEAIVLKAMSSVVETRYQSAAEMAADLEQLQDPAPVSTAQVSQYLKGLFGGERITQKTRIPTLTTLLEQSGGALKAAKPQVPQEVHPLLSDVSEEGTLVTPTAGIRAAEAARARAAAAQAEPSKVERSGASRWLFLAGGLGLGGLVALGVFFFLKPQAPPPPAVVVATPEPVKPPAVVEPAPVPVVVPTPTAPAAAATTQPGAAAPAAGEEVARDAGTEASAPPAPDAVAANPETPPAQEDAKRTAKVVRHTEPVELDAAGVQKVLSRSSGPIRACFETYMDELPGEGGQVAVTFTILGSGKVVNAKVASAFAGTKVGKCVEQRVARLRFPAHKDKEINLTLPFDYHRVGK